MQHRIIIFKFHTDNYNVGTINQCDLIITITESQSYY